MPHANDVDEDVVKCTTTSDTNTTEQINDDNTLKSPELKRKEEVFIKRCLGEIRENSKNLMDSLKANDNIMSMQKIMEKLVDKL